MFAKLRKSTASASPTAAAGFGVDLQVVDGLVQGLLELHLHHPAHEDVHGKGDVGAQGHAGLGAAAAGGQVPRVAQPLHEARHLRAGGRVGHHVARVVIGFDGFGERSERSFADPPRRRRIGDLGRAGPRARDIDRTGPVPGGGVVRPDDVPYLVERRVDLS